jgi:hypothetical protein
MTKPNQTAVAAAAAAAAALLLNRRTNDFRAEMNLMKIESKWPVRYRVEKFSKLDGVYARVRLHHSTDFCHEMVRARWTTRTHVKNCALCSNGNQKRTSMYGCRICEVQLCTTTAIPGSSSSKVTCCHEWHVSTDLKRDAFFRNQQVAAAQSDNKSGKKKDTKTLDASTRAASGAPSAASNATAAAPTATDSVLPATTTTTTTPGVVLALSPAPCHQRHLISLRSTKILES